VNESPTTAPARIPASANETCLPHAALSIFSSTLIDGGWEGGQRQRLPKQHLRRSISSASQIGAHPNVNFGRVEDGRGSLGPMANAPFPIPAHQTGRADFRHPLSDWLHRKAHDRRPLIAGVGRRHLGTGRSSPSSRAFSEPCRLSDRTARQLPDQSTTLGVESSSTSDPRLRGALPIGDIDYAVNLLSADHVGNFSGARLTQFAPFIRSCFIGKISYVAPTSSRIIGSAVVRRSTSVWSFAEKIDSPHPPLGSSTGP
jgi:hypothetical protein